MIITVTFGLTYWQLLIYHHQFYRFWLITGPCNCYWLQVVPFYSSIRTSSEACLIVECCHVNGISPGHTIVEWITMLADFISIDPSQPSAMWASWKSPAVTWWSKWHTHDPIVILPRISSCHMTKEMVLSYLD